MSKNNRGYKGLYKWLINLSELLSDSNNILYSKKKGLTRQPCPASPIYVLLSAHKGASHNCHVMRSRHHHLFALNRFILLICIKILLRQIYWLFQQLVSFFLFFFKIIVIFSNFLSKTSKKPQIISSSSCSKPRGGRGYADSRLQTLVRRCWSCDGVLSHYVWTPTA